MQRDRAPLTREAILTEALAVVARDGAGALSLRGIAGTLGVTAPALYLHFASKDDLVRAVAADEFDRLIARLQRAADESPDPLERIRVQARAYVAHAVERPALFEVLLMFRPSWTPQPGGEDFPLASKAWEVGAAPVEDAIARGLLGDQDPFVAALTLWAATHGIATLLAAGPQLGTDAERALVESVIDTVIAGLRAERADH
jgi:AcrR family transcriptional regulator